ncbi:MAG: response regulator [Candidatus Methanoperedens sp.]|nr:response regulator [Candidatus Methanoperedens sp.]
MMQKKPKSILIVDSEPDVAGLFEEMLLMDVDKYIINTAYTGNDCLLALERDMPDMVLLDMDFMDMDGWELIEKIKETRSEIPVVVISSKPPCIDDFLCLSMVSDYLMKPVTLDGFLMAVKDALEIPALLQNCIENIRHCKGKEEIMYLVFSLLKQGIADRKRFILMRQLYPDRILENDPGTKLLLYNLKDKIGKTTREIDSFKNNKVLIA